MPKLIDALATWFYLGRLKPGPGTWGTLGAIPVVLALQLFGPMGYLVGALVFAVVAILVATLYERFHDGHDHSEVVIDEVVGFVITMTWLPHTWQAWVAGFLLFRLIDIVKPPPIRQLDLKIPGGLGVVADDIGAGIAANIILQIIFTNTSWLGHQLPLSH